MAITDPSTPDWATFLTKRLDGLVGLIRDKSLRPATQFTRYAIVGTLAAIVGVAVVIMVIVGIIHLFDVTVFRHHAFATDFLFGGILLLSGMFLLRTSAKIGRTS